MRILDFVQSLDNIFFWSEFLFGRAKFNQIRNTELPSNYSYLNLIWFYIAECTQTRKTSVRVSSDVVFFKQQKYLTQMTEF